MSLLKLLPTDEVISLIASYSILKLGLVKRRENDHFYLTMRMKVVVGIQYSLLCNIIQVTISCYNTSDIMTFCMSRLIPILLLDINNKNFLL